MRQMEAEMAKKNENVPAKAVESLFNKVSDLIEQARVRVATAMNVAEVYRLGDILWKKNSPVNNARNTGNRFLRACRNALRRVMGMGGPTRI